MGPFSGADGEKNGDAPFFIWQKQEMAPYGAKRQNGAIWRHI